MTDIAEFDAETPVIKQTRKQRAERLTSGPRGKDQLTDAERVLLDTLRKQGYDIRRSFLIGADGQSFAHGRVVTAGTRSWYSSIDG